MAASSAQAKRLALLATGGAVVIASVGSAAHGEWPSARIPLGGLVAAVGLTAMAEVWPAGAAGLAVVILTSAVFVVGGDAWTAIARTLNPPK